MLRSKSGRQLPDFHAGLRDGIEAAGGEAFVSFEKAVHRIVLLDITACQLKKYDRAIEPDFLVVDCVDQRGIGCENVPLLRLGGFEEVARSGILGNGKFAHPVDLLFVSDEGVGRRGGDVSVQQPLHAGHRIRRSESRPFADHRRFRKIDFQQP